MTLLRRLNAAGTTIVLITHDRDIAAGLPRRVEIRDGSIVGDSTGAADTSGTSGTSNASGTPGPGLGALIGANA